MANRDSIIIETQDKKAVMLTKNESFCPFIAQKVDPETHYAFATTASFCHQVKPAKPINLSYQDTVCLTGKYSTCPVYLGAWKKSLPKEIRGERAHKKKSPRKKWGWLLVTLVGIALAWLLIYLQVWNDFIPTPVPSQDYVSYVQSTASYTPTLSSTPKSGLAAVISQTEEGVSNDEPTGTATGTVTYSIPTPGPFLKTPFGPRESFVVHLVVEGESVGKIASMYNTSSEVIIAVNGLEEDYYFIGARTPKPTSDKPYQSPTPTLAEDAVPTVPPTATKRAIPTVRLYILAKLSTLTAKLIYTAWY